MPVLYPDRSGGGLKSQPSLLNHQSALFNNPFSKTRPLFPSRPKSEATAQASGATPAVDPQAQHLRRQSSAERPVLQPSDSVGLQRTATGGATSLQDRPVKLARQASHRKVGACSVEVQGAGEREPSAARPPPPLPPRHRAEVYLALVGQVAVVADGGEVAMWCRSLRYAKSVLARALFRKALELYECGTRPHHLQPLLRLQHTKHQAVMADPG